MKGRFTTLDLIAAVTELKETVVGARVASVYDIDNKTYLFKLTRPGVKMMLLVESSSRIHTTDFDWPKSQMPSGFAMKLRKHLNNKRLVSIEMLGIDRIVDIQFGSDEAAHHVILEAYDRGNIVLTDHEYTILNILRTRTEKDTDVKFLVRERYPIESAKQLDPPITLDRLQEILVNSNRRDSLRKILTPNFVFGGAVIDHFLRKEGFPEYVKIGDGFSLPEDIPRLLKVIQNAEELLNTAMSKTSKGYIIQKRDKKPSTDVNSPEGDELLTYQEFHPLLFQQHSTAPVKEFPSFIKAVDEFFSNQESQRFDMKVLQQEKTALKKLENVKKDHIQRLDALQKAQEEDTTKASYIEFNLDLVDKAILIINSAIANQMGWDDIQNIVQEARMQGDPVASCISNLKLGTNQITMKLSDPYQEMSSDDDEELTQPAKRQHKKTKFLKIDINLALSAHANARSYYDRKRYASKKEQKTLEASTKALKSAEKKTKDTLKEVQTTASIQKSRKTYWFEKFFWFISSENFMIIGGRDSQQNELIVKRHLNPGDVYVHADLHGASSIVIKNPSGEPVPHKTLLEAGTMAVCYSAAWDHHVVTSAWWVYHDQVSKTAPTGEYLTTGAFMIRGKKNYLPHSYLMMGFGFLFRIDESCVSNHLNERKVKTAEEDAESIASMETVEEEEEEISIADDSEDENESQEKPSGSQDESVRVDQDSDEDEESMYPDTSIDLQFVRGSKFQLQRGISTASTASMESDGTDLAASQQGEARVVQHLSAKQRRNLKKTGKLTGEENTDQRQTQQQTQKNQEQKKQEQPKRGKKAKLKKIKEKYGDQDEEERELMMEILQSAGPQRGAKTKKEKRAEKKNKAYQQNRQNQQQQKQSQQQKNIFSQYQKSDKSQKQTEEDETQKLPEVNANSETDIASQDTNAESCADREESREQSAPNIEKDPDDSATQGTGETNDELARETADDSHLTLDTSQSTKLKTPSSETHEQASSGDPDMETGAGDKDAAENSSDDEGGADASIDKYNLSLLDHLTGCPVPDDILMFAIPVCAPYSTMQNYKFKVKLTPGSVKRGKAAKTALNMFLYSKESSSREKDLLKSVKDNDLSRYLPGKVKVSAPNLQRQKQRAKQKQK